MGDNMEISATSNSETEETNGNMPQQRIQHDLRTLDYVQLRDQVFLQSEPNNVIILYDGPTCDHRSNGVALDIAENEVKESSNLCSVFSLAAAAAALKLYAESMAKVAGGDHEPNASIVGDAFLEALLTTEIIERCSKAEDGKLIRAAHDSDLDSFKSLKDVFENAAPEVRYLTQKNILSSLQEMEAQPGLVVAFFIHQAERVLFLSFAMGPSTSGYLLFDPHTRQDPARGGAILLLKSLVDASDALWEVWNPKDGDLSSGSRKFSYTIIPLTTLLSPPPISFPQEKHPLSKNEDQPEVQSHADKENAIEVRPPSPPPQPQPAEDTSKSELKNNPFATTLTTRSQSPASSLRSHRSAASQIRAQKEFGWQLELQNQPLVTPLEKNPIEAESNEIALVASPHISGTPASSLSYSGPSEIPEDGKAHGSTFNEPRPSTPGKSNEHKSLENKDIGWQLALQREIGTVILPSRTELVKKDLGVASGSAQSLDHKSQTSLNSSSPIAPPLVSGSIHNSSKTNLSLKSGKSGGKSLRSAAFDLEGEARRPNREEFGWQEALAAKSITLPRQQTPSAPIQTSHRSAVNVTHSSASSRTSPPFGVSEFGAAVRGEVNSSAALLERKPTPPPWTPSHSRSRSSVPSVAGSQQSTREPFYHECGHCFGRFAEDQLITISTECMHRACKDCIRRHCIEALESFTFPILCPTCRLEQRLYPKTLTIEMLERLEFGRPEIDKYLHLRFQTLPVQVRCPKCDHLVHMTRSELKLSKHLQCENSDCRYQFCRACHQEFEIGPVAHICKETKYRRRISKVFKKRGSRYCPGCQSLVSRESDNLLVCSPMCGMQFDYHCGDVVADKGAGEDAEQLVQTHYAPGSCPRRPQKEECTIQ